MLLFLPFEGHSPSHGIRRDSPLKEGAKGLCVFGNSTLNWHLANVSLVHYSKKAIEIQ